LIVDSVYKAAANLGKDDLLGLWQEHFLACVAGVNGEGEGKRERGRKIGALGARDEGTPATKTLIFSSPPTNFKATQLS